MSNSTRHHAPRRQPTITAAVIALNEVQHIEAWLAASSWADERLLIDGGSTDGTAALAEKCGARVLVRSFDNFANQRNYALAEAAHDWVLFIDADERPHPRLVDELRQRLPSAREAAFHVPIRSRIFGHRFRFSGTQNDRPLRLVRRGAGAWRGAVHETFASAGARGSLAGWLEHTTMPTRAALLTKVERYTTLEAESRVAADRPPRWHAPYLAPPREVFRRLIWKQGWLDGPVGWEFCLLSGYSEWRLAQKHAALWRAKHANSTLPSVWKSQPAT